MPSASRFARSRAMKACVALCAVSALAFALGQGAAALRASLTSASATARPQIAERVVGAQRAIAAPTTPPRQSEQQVTFTTGAHQTRPAKGRHGDKQRPSHEKAAGDSSHGGSSHSDGGKSGGHDN